VRAAASEAGVALAMGAQAAAIEAGGCLPASHPAASLLRAVADAARAVRRLLHRANAGARMRRGRRHAGRSPASEASSGCHEAQDFDGSPADAGQPSAEACVAASDASKAHAERLSNSAERGPIETRWEELPAIPEFPGFNATQMPCEGWQYMRAKGGIIQEYVTTQKARDILDTRGVESKLRINEEPVDDHAQELGRHEEGGG